MHAPPGFPRNLFRRPLQLGNRSLFIRDPRLTAEPGSRTGLILFKSEKIPVFNMWEGGGGGYSREV